MFRIPEERHLERERWHFAVERVDEAPTDDATVIQRPFNLSKQDKRVIEAALDAAYAGSSGIFGPPEFDELQTVEYHQGLDAEASELVPSPPFDFVQEGHDYFHPVTNKQIVSVPEWTYRVDSITDTRENFTEYAREAMVEYVLDSGGACHRTITTL